MAKPKIDSPLRQTTKPEQPAQDDPIESNGVGLKASEWRELEAIAQELGKNRHYVAAYALRYFLKAYRAGDIKPETKKTQTLPGL
jgi:hypothetical protein